MRKVMSLVVVAMMSLSLFVGCGSKEEVPEGTGVETGVEAGKEEEKPSEPEKGNGENPFGKSIEELLPGRSDEDLRHSSFEIEMGRDGSYLVREHYYTDKGSQIAFYLLDEEGKLINKYDDNFSKEDSGKGFNEDGLLKVYIFNPEGGKNGRLARTSAYINKAGEKVIESDDGIQEGRGIYVAYEITYDDFGPLEKVSVVYNSKGEEIYRAAEGEDLEVSGEFVIGDGKIINKNGKIVTEERPRSFEWESAGYLSLRSETSFESYDSDLNKSVIILPEQGWELFPLVLEGFKGSTSITMLSNEKCVVNKGDAVVAELNNAGNISIITEDLLSIDKELHRIKDDNTLEKVDGYLYQSIERGVLKLSEKRANGEPGFTVVTDLQLNEIIGADAKLTSIYFESGTGSARNEAGEDVEVFVGVTTGKVIEKDALQEMLFGFLDFIGY